MNEGGDQDSALRATTTPASPKLRVGLLLDSLQLPAWAYRMVERIQSSDYARIDLLVLNGAPKHRGSFLRRLARNRRYLLYIAYTWADRTLFCQSPDAFEIIDASALLRDVPRVTVQPEQSRFVDRFTPSDIERLGKHQLDVFIRLGFRILKGGILDSARYGVWSFHHGDNEVNRGGPPGFWEVFGRERVTGSLLQRLTEDIDDGIVLCRSFSATDQASVHRNRNNVYWKSLSFVPRSLERLHRSPDDHPVLDASPLTPRHYSGPLYRPPTNMAFTRLILPHLTRLALRRLRNMVFVSSSSRWALLFDIGSGRSRSLRRFKMLRPPRGRFWADPHIVRRDDRYYVFFEDYSIAEQRGCISVLTIDDQGHASEPRVALTRPFHLSYPFIFEWQSELFMIPETSANGTIEAYRCERFPDQWRFERTLMRDVVAVDSTLFQSDGTWWLFTNMANKGASTWDELHLFHSRDPLSDAWMPHPLNPVVSDVRRARPAGRLFRRNGRIYRPSQDCSRGYGYAIRIHEVVRLEKDRYEELEVERIEPRWDKRIEGIHTWSEEGALAVVDVRIRRGFLGRGPTTGRGGQPLL